MPVTPLRRRLVRPSPPVIRLAGGSAHLFRLLFVRRRPMCFPHEEPRGQGQKTPRLRLRRAQVGTSVGRALLPRRVENGKVLEVTMPKITALRVVARCTPTIENGKGAPPRPPANRGRRKPKDFTAHEVDR